MKGVQQCRDVQADFVCKLEKEQVDAFEVYPNTVRLNLLNGCPSRPPLRLCCIFFVFCETREGTISLFPFIFFLQTPPLTRPPPSQFATATKAINHCPSIHGEVSYAWSRSINVLVHVDQKMVNSSLTRTRLSTSSATMS